MTLQQLIYAVKIADMKSMNRAATELFVSQPALSATVRGLEEEIRTEIFLRTNRGITITPEGEEFLSYARQMVEMQKLMEDRYLGTDHSKKKFSVSMQHYSFAVEAFIDLAKEFGMEEYEFAVHETKTAEVIDNVRNYRSELGILYLNPFNEKALKKSFAENEVEYTLLFQCGISVYMSNRHPLAKKERLDFQELEPYPCLSFEQGDKNSFYFAEEVLSMQDYPRIIKADDRATMLNLMTGLDGYTLCSGIICEKLNGNGYTAIPLNTQERMDIGYIRRKHMPLSKLGKKYLEILKKYG
ncbi:MAG: LysR family transcriptional regulator [Eubacteriales bacterium]|nr:LysR family transcriptional regulator [Eubacteriales bacterium]